ncbi:MAG: peptidoglycan DD-metalloendopeptidase family protein [Thermoleophilia bacterium]
MRRTSRQARLRAAVLTAVVAGAALAGGGAHLAAQSASKKKEDVDKRLQRAEQRLQQVRGREAVLTSQVAVYSGRIREVEAKLAPLQTRLTRLEDEVAQLEARLAVLNSRLDSARRRLADAETRLVQSQGALSDRLREIYRVGEPDPILAMLEAGSLTDALETQAMLKRISDRDGALVSSAKRYATEAQRARDEIRDARDEVQVSEERATAAAQELRTATDELKGRKAELEKVKGQRAALLSRVKGDREDIEAETKDLQRESAALAAKIVAAQSGGRVSVDTTISSRGMIYPVNGPLTSGFGMRWGRMHEGIDIGVGTGTPVVAAASGTVISAGWGGGYGNLVVIDHGGGIATAYAHNSRLVVSAGQQVTQGTVIAYSGSTGHSTGPHVHFEVRVNGQAVDPIPYL